MASPYGERRPPVSAVRGTALTSGTAISIFLWVTNNKIARARAARHPPRSGDRVPTGVAIKAIVQDRYGSPAGLRCGEVDVPGVEENGILVEVHAAAVNALDWHTCRGQPYLIRLSEGWRRPRHAIRGVDLAGRVVAVGSAVERFAPGEMVFGGSDGSFAEYTVTTADRLARLPAGWDPGEAAALHVAGMTALQGLRGKAGVRPGQRVLINGAGGGVGTCAVQIAKWLGAHVTAVTRSESIEMVGSLGADAVVDHRREDFTRSRERFDVIFDVGGNRSLLACRRVLAPGGTFVAVGAPAGRWLSPASRMLATLLLNHLVRQRFLPFLSRNDAADLDQLRQLAETKVLRTVVDRTYPLPEAPKAIEYVGAGHARGKVIITVR